MSPRESRYINGTQYSGASRVPLRSKNPTSSNRVAVWRAASPSIFQRAARVSGRCDVRCPRRASIGCRKSGCSAYNVCVNRTSETSGKDCLNVGLANNASPSGGGSPSSNRRICCVRSAPRRCISSRGALSWVPSRVRLSIQSNVVGLLGPTSTWSGPEVSPQIRSPRGHPSSSASWSFAIH
jgi:hypothetical protein